jgi:hypothetical protein
MKQKDEDEILVFMGYAWGLFFYAAIMNWLAKFFS